MKEAIAGGQWRGRCPDTSPPFPIGTLLVYGTLRPNRGEEVVLTGYRMFDMGWYPAIVKGEPDDKIICERVKVKDEDHLASLDAYEGCNGNTDRCLYHRVQAGDDWIYVYNHDIDESRDMQVMSGDWLEYKNQGAGSNSQLTEA